MKESESEVTQSCLTLCDPMHCSLLGSSIHGISQTRILEWVAISFCNAWKWKVKVKSLSRVQLLATPWTAAYQAPPSMGFSRQEYWSGVPLPSPDIRLRHSNLGAHLRSFFKIQFLNHHYLNESQIQKERCCVPQDCGSVERRLRTTYSVYTP